MKKIAVIGAGLSGLVAAQKLKDFADITLFEKSRGVSGRMSTRRAEPYFFDHGAQYFTARTDAFKNFIQPMIQDQIIKRWDARFVEFEGKKIIRKRQWGEEYPHYVGAPGMNAIARYLTHGLKIKLSTQIVSITEHKKKWSLTDDKSNTLGEYDWVISSIPPEQTHDFLPDSLLFYPKIKSVKMQACFSLMLGFHQPLNLEFDAALVHGQDINWISVNNSKPDRQDSFCLLINSTNDWADDHIEEDLDQVIKNLCVQTSNVIGYDVSKADHKAIHKWRYANIAKQSGDTHFIDTTQQIGVCGDWCIQGRVEAAFTSGMDLANKVLGAL